MQTKTALAGLALCAMTFGAAPGLAGEGPFSQEQADSGKTAYNNHCATCHRPNLQGGMGPALAGDAFKGKWAGKPVAELRDYIHKAMPPTAPNSLPDDQLDPIVAYILSKNGLTPGQKPLSKDTASGEFTK